MDRVARAKRATPAVSPSERMVYSALGSVRRALEVERLSDTKQPRELRERLVVALMETLNDPYQLPRHEAAEAGPAASKRVPCTVCARTGKIVKDGERVPRPCPGCNGTGMSRRRKGEQAWDEYLNQPVHEAESSLKPPPRQFKLDEDIRRLWFELQRMERVDDTGDDALTKALKAKDWLEKRGSYAELRRALAALHSRSQHVYGAVWRTYVWNVEVEPSAHFEALVGIGISFLAGEMRGEIRVPHAHEQAVSEERKRTVSELAATGMTAGQIARQLAMPKRRVQHELRALTPPVSAPSDLPATT